MISSAWKCLLLWRISILGEAFEQERANEKNKNRGGGGWGGFAIGLGLIPGIIQK